MSSTSTSSSFHKRKSCNLTLKRPFENLSRLIPLEDFCQKSNNTSNHRTLSKINYKLKSYNPYFFKNVKRIKKNLMKKYPQINKMIKNLSLNNNSNISQSNSWILASHSLKLSSLLNKAQENILSKMKEKFSRNNSEFEKRNEEQQLQLTKLNYNHQGIKNFFKCRNYRRRRNKKIHYLNPQLKEGVLNIQSNNSQRVESRHRLFQINSTINGINDSQINYYFFEIPEKHENLPEAITFDLFNNEDIEKRKFIPQSFSEVYEN